MGTTTIDVGTETELNQAIASADAATSGTFDIVFTQGITEGTDTGQSITFGTQDLPAPPDLYAFNLASGVSVTIDGGGNTLDGDDLYRGFFVYAGDVSINDLTIADAHAVGGAGGSGGGGGGAGLGGGLFVAGTGNVDGAGNPLASGGTVTLDGVTFSSDAATGGAGGSGGGFGGGGGLGGAGGSALGGGGGGIGAEATGGSGRGAAGSGIILGAAGGGFNGTGGQGGAFGGGGAAGVPLFGGGGGIGGQGLFSGGGGGFGGGGAEGLHGAGGFGGGGGGGSDTLGAGGFGGGGGSNRGGSTAGGAGGFGAGAGDSGIGAAGGGGGLGAGGDIFVQQGGVLTIEGGSLSGGSVLGGTAGARAGGGSGYGTGIFLQGTAAIALAPLSGQTLSLGDALADQSIAGGTQPAATVTVEGPGVVATSGTGDITVADLQVTSTAVMQLQGTVTATIANAGSIFVPDAATLDLPGTISGSGIIGLGSSAELELGGTVGLGQTLADFAPGDTIHLPNVSFNAGGDTLDYVGGIATISNDGTTLDTLAIGGPEASNGLSLSADPIGGVDLTASNTFTVTDEGELNQAIASVDAATSGSFDIVFAAPTIAEGTDTGDQILFGTQTLSAPPDLYAFNLASGVSVTIDGGGNTLDGADAYRGFFVYAGNVSIDDLTIADAHAVGGAGGSGGGGGAGLGGGLFVAGTGNVDGSGNPLATGGTVTLDAVTFSNDSATGGAGGHEEDGEGGGGGGLGGAAGTGGGGGIGAGASGGGGAGGSGIVLGAASGGAGAGGAAPGSFGGGGGGGIPGGGGGVGGAPGLPLGSAGQGGFGGGSGGRGNSSGGGGGFGGGGGGEEVGPGGSGGFGGGGGGGGGFGGLHGLLAGGAGGFGAGTGGRGNGSGLGGSGGGGLGAGGDVFVQQGGVLTIEGGSLSGGAVQGGVAGLGSGSSRGADGSGYASGIFLQGTAAITLAPLSGETLSLGDALADQSIAGGTQPAATVTVEGPGTVTASGTGDITVADLEVANGGLLQVAGVTIATDPTTIDAGGSYGGYGTLDGAITDNGSITASGGTLDLTGAIDGSGEMLIAGSAELELDGAVGPGLTIAFDGTQAVLDAAATLAMDGTIEHFVTGDTIDLPGVTFDSATLEAPFYSDGTLTIGNTHSLVLDTLAISGPYVSSDFTLSADGSGGTKITTDMPCFALGTRIATARGEIPVECLRVGDRVHTVSGALRPIAWIGHRLVECAPHPRPENVRPVRVLAGAFGDGLPVRDVLLSPDHSLFIDGVLMPVRHLVNGTVVVQETRERIHYFHIELEHHDVLLAEGLPAESYLDTGNRHVFANGRAHMMLHPEFEPLDWYDDAYAPLCVRGKKLEAARRALFDAARRRGWRVADDADLHLLVAGQRIDVASVRGKLHRFELPAGTRELRIMSHSGVPAEIDPAALDRRLLGARIGAVFVAGEFVTLQSAALVSGFHELEGGGGKNWRWTDGTALLRLPAPPARPATLELLVRDTMRHWDLPEHKLVAVA